VLELAAQLNVTADQKAKTEALFKRMQARAIHLGKELIEEERALDKLFASRSVTAEALDSSLDRIARLQGQVRQVHLQAHLDHSFADPRTCQTVQSPLRLWTDAGK
jgi:hypothetical protein